MSPPSGRSGRSGGPPRRGGPGGSDREPSRRGERAPIRKLYPEERKAEEPDREQPREHTRETSRWRAPGARGRLRLVVTCALGLEDILLGELEALGYGQCFSGRGAVSLDGGWPDVWRLNVWLRTANRVLVELGGFRVGEGEAAITRGAFDLVMADRALDGVSSHALFEPWGSVAVRATSSRSRIRDVRKLALETKDGIVDAQRELFGRRSSVDRKSPDLPLRILLDRDRARLLLDTSREPLDRRGYRKETVEAPVREQLAAACILASGWDGRGPVVDPMCGSGTLLIEAGWIAEGRPPGSLRRRWMFERLPGFDRTAFERLKRFRPKRRDVELHGGDTSGLALRAARTNLAIAGLARFATLRRTDAFAFDPPPGPGLVAINPAYGERLEEAPEQWKRLGDLLKQRYVGWRAVVLAGDEGKGKWIGLRPSQRLAVRNGPLDARILVFELY
ncbi:MAG TPA: RNA methyltransferase [Thermoanaerobaculia bacterium]|nr:RNA methyltransferase [Thermoanaerobaculia bacterium]